MYADSDDEDGGCVEPSVYQGSTLPSGVQIIPWLDVNDLEASTDTEPFSTSYDSFGYWDVPIAPPPTPRLAFSTPVRLSTSTVDTVGFEEVEDSSTFITEPAPSGMPSSQARPVANSTSTSQQEDIDAPLIFAYPEEQWECCSCRAEGQTLMPPIKLPRNTCDCSHFLCPGCTIWLGYPMALFNPSSN